MATEVEAVYRNGTLQLKTLLPLEEGQTVRVVVLSDSETSLEDRVKAMHVAANTWLAQQSPETLAARPEYSPEDWARLDVQWDEILAEIQQQSGRHTEEEIAADVGTAVQVARQERRRQRGK